MELKRYDEAIEKFKQLQNINTYERIISINNWYLGLCYLKIGKNENAIEQLEKITDINDNFYKESQELLKKLKK
jgi:tetratricopeptide (TPR) repeat protein